jgi:hypothetical protein
MLGDPLLQLVFFESGRKPRLRPVKKGLGPESWVCLSVQATHFDATAARRRQLRALAHELAHPGALLPSLRNDGLIRSCRWFGFVTEDEDPMYGCQMSYSACRVGPSVSHWFLRWPPLGSRVAVPSARLTLHRCVPSLALVSVH